MRAALVCLLIGLACSLSGLLIQAPKDSSIRLAVNCLNTVGFRPLPVICWADELGGTTASTVGSVDSDLHFTFAYGDDLGNYRIGETYPLSGGNADKDMGAPLGSHLYTAAGSYTITVTAEDSSANTDSETNGILVSDWDGTRIICIREFAPTPDDDSGWAAAGCPVAQAKTSMQTRTGGDLDSHINFDGTAEGTLYALLDGTYTTAGGIDIGDSNWGITGEWAATGATIEMTDCFEGTQPNSSLAAIFDGALTSSDSTLFRIWSLTIDGRGSTGEACFGTGTKGWIQGLLDGDPKGFLAYDLVFTNGISIVANINIQGQGGIANYPDNFATNIHFYRIRKTGTQDQYNSSGNIYRFDAVYSSIRDSYTVGDDTDNDIEYHVRSQHCDRCMMADNKMQTISPQKGLITMRACTYHGGGAGLGDCGGNNNALDDGNIGVGLFTERNRYYRNVFDFGGSTEAGIQLAQNEPCEAHRKEWLEDNVLDSSSGSGIAPGKGMIVVFSYHNETVIRRNYFNGTNFAPGNRAYAIRFAQDSSWACGATGVSPTNSTVVNNSFYFPNDTGRFNAIGLLDQTTTGNRTANNLVYAPNATVVHCDLCDSTRDVWQSLADQGHTVSVSNPFVGNLAPGSTTANDFMLSAPNASGISLPPAGYTDWVGADRDGNAFGQQPGGWANR